MNIFSRRNKYLSIGIQISEHHITLLVADKKGSDKPIIREYVRCQIDDGDSSLEEAINHLRHWLIEKHFKDVSCCCVLGDQDYQLLVIDAPEVPDEEMAEAVKWKIKELIQSPIEEVVTDVFLQPNTTVSNKKIANVVVAHKDIIGRNSTIVQRLGLDLVAVDIPEFSYRNYIEYSDYNDRSVALVLIKESYGKLVVIQKGNVYFSRQFSISYSGGLLDEIPESELVLELQRSLDYYERQLKQAMPSILFLIGENITEDKITDSIRDSFNQKIIVETVDNFEFSDEDSLFSNSIVSSYGAALRKELVA